MDKQLFANNAAAQLLSNITSAATFIPLQTGQGANFPAPAAAEYFLATVFKRNGPLEYDHEVVKCTAVVGDTLTVVRDVEGTGAFSYSALDFIELRMTASAVGRFEDSAIALNTHQSAPDPHTQYLLESALGALTVTFENKTLGNGTSVIANITVNGQTVTPANFGYLAGVTSSIQTQLNNKLGTTATAANSTLLAGVSPSTSAVGNTVATRDAQGDITTRLFRSTFAEQTTAPDAGSDIAFRINSSTDNFIRFMSQAAMKAWLGISSLGTLAFRNTVATSHIDNYAVTATKLPTFTAGSLVINSANTAYFTTATNTKLYETRCPRAGTIRTTLWLDNPSSGTTYGRVYKNGVAYGTLRATNTAGTWTEDLTFAEGDLLQLYGYVSTEGYPANASIYCGVAASVDFFGRTL